MTFLRGHGPLPGIFARQMLMAGAGGDTHGEEQYREGLWEAGLRVGAGAVSGERPHSLVFAT